MQSPIKRTPVPRQEQALRVMGIDPGFALTGVAILGWYQGARLPTLIAGTVLKTQKADQKTLRNLRILADDKQRCQETWDGLTMLADKYQPIHAMGVETYSPWSMKKKTGEPCGMSMAWKGAITYGMCLALGFSRGWAVFPFLAMDLKRKIAGKKGASKEDVEKALTSKIHLMSEVMSKVAKTQHEHIVDATGHAYLTLLEMFEMRKVMGVL